MSILRTHNLQNPDSSSINIVMDKGGNTNITGVTTVGSNFHVTDGISRIGALTEYGLKTVSDKGLIVSSSGEHTLKLIDTTSYTTNVGASILLGGQYRTSGDAQEFVKLKSFKENSSNGNYAYGFSVSTNPHGGVITERLRITSTGLVGIGTVIPTRKLDVEIQTASSAVGSVLSSHPIAEFINISGGAPRGLEIGAPPDGILSPVYLKVSGTGSRFAILDQSNHENFTILDTGLVGIGTHIPNQELHIHASSGTSYVQFTDEASGTGSTNGAVFGLDNPHLYAWNYQAGDFVVATNALERLRVTSGGNVDINGTPPWTVTGGNYRNLSISGSDASSSGFLWLGNGAAATNADFDLGRVNFVNGANIVAQIKGTTQTSANDDGRISFFTKATGSSISEKLRIDSNGRQYHYTDGSLRMHLNATGLGVNTTTITGGRIIHAHNTGTGSAYFQSTNSNTGEGASAGALFGMSGTTCYAPWNYTNGDIVMATNSSEKMRISSGGIIKCGTSSVLKAEINNAVSGHQFISQCSDNNNGFEVYQQHGSNTTRNTFAVYANTGNSNAKNLQFAVRGDGVVSSPQQPTFSAIGFPSHRYMNTWHNVDLSSWNHLEQNGSHFNNSNGRFTAPVAGKYFFIYTSMYHNPSSNDFHNYIVKNGSTITQSNNISGGGSSQGHQWNDCTIQAVVDMAANDYVTARSTGSSSSTCYLYGGNGSRYNTFCGFLIG